MSFDDPTVSRRIELSVHDAADGRSYDQTPRPGDGAGGLILCKPFSS